MIERSPDTPPTRSTSRELLFSQTEIRGHNSSQRHFEAARRNFDGPPDCDRLGSDARGSVRHRICASLRRKIMKTLRRGSTWSDFVPLAQIGPVPKNDPRHRDGVMLVLVLLLVFSLCCPLHAQDNTDFISSDTNVTTIDTKVVIGAPFAVVSKSNDVFSSGIHVGPVYLQAPPGLNLWLSVQCRGGAVVLSVPDYVANTTMVQTDKTGLWTRPSGSLNNTSGLWLVTGLGILLNVNVSVANDALATLTYTKDANNDIAGKATMTITLNWNVTIVGKDTLLSMKRSKRIKIWTPTTLTSVSTFRATVAAVCLVGIFVLCCLGCLNTVAVSSLRRFSVSLAKETRDQQECEQNRVFNPLWMPCAPSQPEHYNIESSPNPLMLQQRQSELQRKILRMSTPFSLMDRLTRVRHLKLSKTAWIRYRYRHPCGTAPPVEEPSSPS